MERLEGSMEFLSTMQVTEDMEGLDAQSKLILHNKEVLAVILQAVVEEYKDYSRREIMEFIESDSITEGKEVSVGRTDTQVRGECSEFNQLNEKVSFFDLLFRAKNPKLSTENMLIRLHIDVESQKTYQPGYPIEKRGMYYLARSLSSQLSLVMESTDYDELEKCYSIWICREDIPKKDCYTISVYETVNTKSTGMEPVAKEKYDLMTLVVIKLGEKEYNGIKGDEGYELLRFLNALMYPHKEDFMDTMTEYIDFSNNEKLWEEVTHMIGLGQSVLNEGMRQGIQQGIQALVLDNIEEQISKERTIVKLQKRFGLTEEKSMQYYERFAPKA